MTRPLPTKRLELGDPSRWSLSSLRRLVKGALGSRARIWEETAEDGSKYYIVGLERNPGRSPLSWGVDPTQAVERAFDPFNQEFKRPADAPKTEVAP